MLFVVIVVIIVIVVMLSGIADGLGSLLFVGIVVIVNVVAIININDGFSFVHVVISICCY